MLCGSLLLGNTSHIYVFMYVYKESLSSIVTKQLESDSFQQGSARLYCSVCITRTTLLLLTFVVNYHPPPCIDLRSHTINQIWWMNVVVPRHISSQLYGNAYEHYGKRCDSKMYLKLKTSWLTSMLQDIFVTICWLSF